MLHPYYTNQIPIQTFLSLFPSSSSSSLKSMAKADRVLRSLHFLQTSNATKVPIESERHVLDQFTVVFMFNSGCIDLHFIQLNSTILCSSSASASPNKLLFRVFRSEGQKINRYRIAKIVTVPSSIHQHNRMAIRSTHWVAHSIETKYQWNDLVVKCKRSRASHNRRSCG